MISNSQSRVGFCDFRPLWAPMTGLRAGAGAGAGGEEQNFGKRHDTWIHPLVAGTSGKCLAVAVRSHRDLCTIWRHLLNKEENQSNLSKIFHRALRHPSAEAPRRTTLSPKATPIDEYELQIVSLVAGTRNRGIEETKVPPNLSFNSPALMAL